MEPARRTESRSHRALGGRHSAGKKDHSATNKVCAKAHSASNHCLSGRNPLRRPISFNSSGRYLCELSVQMVSPSIKGTLQCARGIVTLCARVESRCISMRRSARIVSGQMAEGGKIEIGLQFAIHASQHVEIKGGGNAQRDRHRPAEAAKAAFPDLRSGARHRPALKPGALRQEKAPRRAIRNCRSCCPGREPAIARRRLRAAATDNSPSKYGCCSGLTSTLCSWPNSFEHWSRAFAEISIGL